MKIGSYNKCKTTSASKHQLISVLLAFVNSLTKVITVFAFFNTLLYYSRNDINSLMQAPDAKSVKM